MCIMKQQSVPAHRHLNLNLAEARLDSLEAGRDTRQNQHHAGQHRALATLSPFSCRILTGEPGFCRCGANFPMSVHPREELPHFFRSAEQTVRRKCSTKTILTDADWTRRGPEVLVGWVGGRFCV